MPRCQHLRNIAIVAHVDHGKTTLIDAMLKQSGAFGARETVEERVMDSNPLEKERGITIFSKHAAVTKNGVTINIIDTPGHADFGGEVERILQMADGVLLLVDAAEGPLPQTKFVLKKALTRGLKAVVLINKIDRPDAQPHDTLDKIFDLFVELGATDEQLDFPVLYGSSREGYARTEMDNHSPDLEPLFQTLLAEIPGPVVEPEKPLQLLVTNTDHSDYIGRLAIGRISRGTLNKGQSLVAIRHQDDSLTPFRATALYTYQGVKRLDKETAEAGQIVVLAGLDDIMIGDTIADPQEPQALPGLTVDEPTLTMVFSVNNSPFAGREGQFLTTRHLRDRLFKEALTNLSLRVQDTDSPDALQVAGRGELHLSILIETMRREGYEFQVSKPEVILHHENGKTLEPYEDLSIDVNSEDIGACIERLGRRKAEMKHMETLPSGRTRAEFAIPTRCLLGFRTEMLSLTRGEGIMHHTVAGYQEYKPGFTSRNRGVLIADQPGTSTAYALFQLADRGTYFIASGTEVYPGMIIGEHCREQDLSVNITKTKQLSNMRSKAADEALTVAPPRKMSLEQLLEYIAEDELVEITPASLRLRKKILDPLQRKRAERAKQNTQ
ncbi:translational GTPase TypA [candidate division FCPU426 bacterium]|nr:translational GTPase TypA [candidate division FCPU426 bacterium]